MVRELRLVVICVALVSCSTPQSTSPGNGNKASNGDGTAAAFESDSTQQGVDNNDTDLDKSGGVGSTPEPGTDGVEDEDATIGSEPGPVCPPDSKQCDGWKATKICAPDGSKWLDSVPCGDGEMCFEGQCSGVICTPGQKVQECASPTAYLQCNEVGTHWMPVECPEGQTCYKGQCLNLQCQPDSVNCKGFAAIQKCKSDGSGWELKEFCEKGGSCINGECVTACEVNLKAATYRGCEYYAVDLDNIEGGQKEPMALVVSVPSNVNDAEVSVFDLANGKDLSASDMKAVSLKVKAGSLGIFQLPPGNDLDGSGVSKKSYHVKTSSPSTVHQFNPLNGDQVYTNDASLLFPSKVGGYTYYVMSWPTRSNEKSTLHGFATVVATEQGETQVTIRPRCQVNAGPEGTEFKTINQGEEVTFTLTQGQVLNVESGTQHGSDLTGSLITGTKRLVVFSGHECANVPLGITACDHIEQQLLPVEAWGQKYVADGFSKRSPAQFDVWRIMAGGTDVIIETNPPQKGYEKFMLQSGAYLTFPSSESFEIKGNGPFMVGHYMVGSNYPGHKKSCSNPDTGSESGIGDPALTLSVPMIQYLKEYTVLTPPGYKESYINIIAPAGAGITVDGQPMGDPIKQIGALAWGIARVKVSSGVHTIKGKKKFGLTSYGYDCDVSYAYPGGLRLLSLDVVKY